MWEKTIATDKQTIVRYQRMLVDLERSKELALVKSNFGKKALQNADEETAYYMVNGFVKGNARSYFVSPKYVVLNEPVKDL